MVERSVQYAKERFFKGGDFKDLNHLRSEAVRWCRDAAELRIHGTTRRQPLQVFLDEERPFLPPWDGEPYQVTHWRSAKVHPGSPRGLPVRPLEPDAPIEVKGWIELYSQVFAGW